MSSFKTYVEFNAYLCNTNSEQKTINQYFHLYHSIFTPNLDITFMNRFTELLEYEENDYKDDDRKFCISADELVTYDILTNSKNIDRTVERSGLILNVDYKILTAPPGGVKRTQQGGANGNKKIYKLTPSAFKEVLINAYRTNIYRQYYLLLEKIMNAYNKYQIMYKDMLLSGKDTKIDEQSKKIDDLLDENKKQSAKIDELLKFARETKDQNDELKDTVDDIKDTVDDIKYAFEDTANRSVPDPSDVNDRHEFILLQNNQDINRFVFLRGMKKFNESKIPTKYKNFKVIRREYNANPIQLYKQFKETIKNNFEEAKEQIKKSKCKNKVELKRKVQKIKFKGIQLELLNEYTLNDLLDDLQKECDEKFNEYNNFKDKP